MCIFTLHIEINIQQSVLVSTNMDVGGRCDVSSGRLMMQHSWVHGYIHTPVNLGSTHACQSQGSCCVLFI